MLHSTEEERHMARRVRGTGRERCSERKVGLDEDVEMEMHRNKKLLMITTPLGTG